MAEWRKLGDLTLEQFKAELSAYRSPMLEEAQAVYAVLRGHSIFATTILYHEKKFDTYNQIIPQNFHNPFAWSSGWANGGHTWHRFPNYESAAKQWLAWVLSSDSPFAGTRTVEEFVRIYAPSSDGNDERLYVSKFNEYYDKYGGGVVPPTDPGTLTFGNCKVPKYDTRIVVKPWEGAGFDRVPPRNNVGMCMHKWWGFGDKYALYRLFSTGGERQADALTDWSLTQEGELVLLNEPWKTRAGWANGPANDLEGDGILFVRKLGVVAVNSRLVSCEFEGKDEKLTDAQMDLGSSLWAYYYDAWGVSWEDYPMNPKVDCVTDVDHWEIGDKECPFTGARSQRHQFQSLVKGKLKAGQLGVAPDPVDPAPLPDHDWLPAGFTFEVMEELFGTGVREETDHSETSFKFDEKGLISNAWIAQAAKYNIWPAANHWWRIQDNQNPQLIRNIVSFSNGWVLMGNDGDRASWNWR